LEKRERKKRSGGGGGEFSVMVLYFKARPDAGDYTIYMGADKNENEELIKYGLPEDVWYVAARRSPLSQPGLLRLLRPAQPWRSMVPGTGARALRGLSLGFGFPYVAALRCGASEGRRTQTGTKRRRRRARAVARRS